MRCPACGADEVVESAIYCHKCGARVDLQPDSADRPRQEGASAADGPDQESTDPVERLQGAMAARRRAADEPEKDLWNGTYSSKAMIGAWVVCGAVTVTLLVVALWYNQRWLWYAGVVAALLAWLYNVLVYCYRRLSVRYRLTSRRFFHEKGILRHVTDRIELIDIDDIAFEQSLIDRFIGVGTIRITSSDRSDPILVIPGIEKVKDVAGMIDEIRLQERLRRGLHIESI